MRNHLHVKSGLSFHRSVPCRAHRWACIHVAIWRQSGSAILVDVRREWGPAPLLAGASAVEAFGSKALEVLPAVQLKLAAFA